MFLYRNVLRSGTFWMPLQNSCICLSQCQSLLRWQTETLGDFSSQQPKIFLDEIWLIYFNLKHPPFSKTDYEPPWFIFQTIASSDNINICIVMEVTTVISVAIAFADILFLLVSWSYLFENCGSFSSKELHAKNNTFVWVLTILLWIH